MIGGGNGTKFDNSTLLDEAVLLFYLNETRPNVRVSCPHFVEDTRIGSNRRVLITVTDKQTMDFEDFYTLSPYK